MKKSISVVLALTFVLVAVCVVFVYSDKIHGFREVYPNAKTINFDEPILIGDREAFERYLEEYDSDEKRELFIEERLSEEAFKRYKEDRLNVERIAQESLERFLETRPNIEDEMINEIVQYFEESENRSFEISYPLNIENEEYYQIIVNGITNSGNTYLIDIFATSPQNINRYFYSSDTEQFQQFYTVPTFACKTSPDKEFRIESVGMHEDGPSGLHALKEMRIINLLTGNIEWSSASYLMNHFIWSDNSPKVKGTYIYDLINKTINIVEIDEVSFG